VYLQPDECRDINDRDKDEKGDQHVSQCCHFLAPLEFLFILKTYLNIFSIRMPSLKKYLNSIITYTYYNVELFS